MEDSELYLMARAKVRPESSKEEYRHNKELLDKHEIEIRSHAAELISNIFNICCAGQGDGFGFEDMELDKDGLLWSGEESVFNLPDPDGDLNHIIEITKRWIRLETPAPTKYNALAPNVGYEVKKRLILGTHDFRFTSDCGQTWTELDPAGSIETVTSLFIVPKNIEARVDLKSGDVVDPFEHGPIFLERLYDMHRPVFDFTGSEIREVFRSKIAPDLKNIPVRSDRLNSIGDSIDYLENAL